MQKAGLANCQPYSYYCTAPELRILHMQISMATCRTPLVLSVVLHVEAVIAVVPWSGAQEGKIPCSGKALPTGGR